MAQLRWQQIQKQLVEIDKAASLLRDEWNKLKDACEHPKLPRREAMESHIDTCPDCGFVSYCYVIGSI